MADTRHLTPVPDDSYFASLMDQEPTGSDEPPAAPPAVEEEDDGPRDPASGERLYADRQEAFWNSRPELLHIQQAAYATGMASWAVLGAVMTRVASLVPYWVTLQSAIGTKGTMNLFVAAVGSSGTGKSSAMDVASELVSGAPTVGLGSGEGLLSNFLRWDPAQKEMVRHAHSALILVDEISTVAALKDRLGSTLMTYLKTAWSGGMLATKNATSERDRRVEAHEYRLCLYAGVQPELAGVLLDEKDGGIPQRFLWLPAYERKPYVVPEHPGELPWGRHGVPALNNPENRAMVSLPSEVIDYIRARHRALSDYDSLKERKPVGLDLDGHALYTRVRVAAVLALLDHRTDVTMEDWELSGVVMMKSNETRQECADAVAQGAARRNEARGVAAASQEEAGAAELERRCSKRVTEMLSSGPKNRKTIRGRLSAPQRTHLTAALALLMDDGIIEQDEEGSYALTR